jgi:hypothetical protein
MTPRAKTTATIATVAIVGFLIWRRKPIATVTTSEAFDLSSIGGPVTYPAPIKRFAEAIARAEGFYVAGSIPQRAHNPGDLKMPNWTGPTLGSGISVFQSDGAGWSALYRQLWIIVTGSSGNYYLDMSIEQMAAKWTATEQSAWARNVAGFLAVDPSVSLVSVLV